MTDQKDDPFSPLLPRLRRRARRLCNTVDDSEDLLQETVMRLMLKLRGGAAISAPDRYAMIILHKLARQLWRQRRDMEELTEDMMQTAPQAPARLACADLRAAIARLPAEQMLLMQLVQEGESSPQVLASRTGLPLGTVMSRLARARVRLRAEMDMTPQSSVSDLM